MHVLHASPSVCQQLKAGAILSRRYTPFSCSFPVFVLSQVLAKKEGVWIGDCVTFMQNPNNPSADVVLGAMEHRLSSMVVDVMYSRAPRRPLLAIYLATSTTCSPAVLQV